LVAPLVVVIEYLRDEGEDDNDNDNDYDNGNGNEIRLRRRCSVVALVSPALQQDIDGGAGGELRLSGSVMTSRPQPTDRLRFARRWSGVGCVTTLERRDDQEPRLTRGTSPIFRSARGKTPASYSP
jgi:hypothetical protein